MQGQHHDGIKHHDISTICGREAYKYEAVLRSAWAAPGYMTWRPGSSCLVTTTHRLLFPKSLLLWHWYFAWQKGRHLLQLLHGPILLLSVWVASCISMTKKKTFLLQKINRSYFFFWLQLSSAQPDRSCHYLEMLRINKTAWDLKPGKASFDASTLHVPAPAEGLALLCLNTQMHMVFDFVPTARCILDFKYWTWFILISFFTFLLLSLALEGLVGRIINVWLIIWIPTAHPRQCFLTANPAPQGLRNTFSNVRRWELHAETQPHSPAHPVLSALCPQHSHHTIPEPQPQFDVMASSVHVFRNAFYQTCI